MLDGGPISPKSTLIFPIISFAFGIILAKGIFEKNLCQVEKKLNLSKVITVSRLSHELEK